MQAIDVDYNVPVYDVSILIESKLIWSMERV